MGRLEAASSDALVATLNTFHDQHTLSVVLSQFHSVVLTNEKYTDIRFDEHVE